MTGIFKGKAYGSVNVGERGQIVIPAGLRKDLNILPGEQIMVFAEPDKKLISMMHVRDFSALLEKAGKIISQLETHVPKRGTNDKKQG
ncbi:MAG: AbrB/MazE/SpoVT family DNA-binding domain-containing protein [Candidatus Omnitrophica bacterium]|nr:AbrB/MazE/SpoVT family DNA-binding domain-containing protein [Candidatus Omnitrophota bacterium]